MNGTAFLMAAVIGLLLAETRVSHRHAGRLRARGAILPPGDVYRAMAVLYPAAFLTMGLEGLWRSTVTVETAGAREPSFLISGLVLFAASKGLKYWAIGTLGERWTFRVFVMPGWPLVRTGPYRYIAHPNYVAVMGELVGTAMMMGARIAGPVMIVLFGAALWARIRFEARVHARYSPATFEETGT